MSVHPPSRPIPSLVERPSIGRPRVPVRPAAVIGILGVASTAETVRVTDACTACGACLATCPEGALRKAPKRPDVDDVACTACWACIEICPAGAILEVRA